MNPKRVHVPGLKTVVNHKSAESAVEENVMATMTLQDLVQIRTEGNQPDFSAATVEQIKDLLETAYANEQKFKAFSGKLEDQLLKFKASDRPAMRRQRYISRLMVMVDGIVEQNTTPLELPNDLGEAIQMLKGLSVPDLKRVLKGLPGCELDLERFTPEEVVNQLIVDLAQAAEQQDDAAGIESEEEIVAEGLESDSAEQADDEDTQDDQPAAGTFDFTEDETPVVTVADDSELESEEESDEDDSDEDSDEDDAENSSTASDFERAMLDLVEAETHVQFVNALDDLSEALGTDITEPVEGTFKSVQSALIQFLGSVEDSEEDFNGLEVEVCLNGAIQAANSVVESLDVREHSEGFGLVRSNPVAMTAKARLVVIASMADIHDLYESRTQLANIPVAQDEFAPQSINFYHTVRGLSSEARPSHKRYGALAQGLRATFDEISKFNSRELLIAGPIATIPETLEVVGSNLADSVADLFVSGMFGVEDIPLDMSLSDFVSVSSQTDLDNDGNPIFTIYTALRVPFLFAETTRENLYKALLNLSDDTGVETTLVISGNSRDIMFNRDLVDGDDVYDLAKAFGDGADYSTEKFTLSELSALAEEVHGFDEDEDSDEDDFDDMEELEEDTDEDDSDDEELEDEELYSFDTTIVPIETEYVAPWGEDVFAIIAVEHPELDTDEDEGDE